MMRVRRRRQLCRPGAGAAVDGVREGGAEALAEEEEEEHLLLQQTQHRESFLPRGREKRAMLRRHFLSPKWTRRIRPIRIQQPMMPRNYYERWRMLT